MAALRLALTLARMLAGQALRRLGVTLALWALACVFLLIGLLGLTMAAWIGLAQAFGPVMAALLVGAGGLILSGIMMLIARNRRHLPQGFDAGTAPLRDAVKDHQAEIETWVPLIGLAVLGFLLGRGKKG